MADILATLADKRSKGILPTRTEINRFFSEYGISGVTPTLTKKRQTAFLVETYRDQYPALKKKLKERKKNQVARKQRRINKLRAA